MSALLRGASSGPADADRAVGAGGRAAPARSRWLLLSGRGVDPRLVRLAEDMLATPARPLEGARGGAAADGAAALVLWSAARGSLAGTGVSLEALASDGVPFGLIPSHDPDVAAAFLSRTLSSPELPDRGRTAVVSTAFEAAGRPACINDSDPSVVALVRDDLDLLVLHGHGNALDLDLGRSAILCSRARVPRPAGPGLFPCFQPGGKCFRQVRDHAAAELVDPGGLNARLVVTVSCHVVSAGVGAYPTDVGIVPSLMAGRMVAGLFTIGATAMGGELVTLALCLLHEGRPLGQVARLLNEFHAAQGVATGIGPGWSPFAVIGNPRARLVTDRLQRARVVGRPGGAIVARLPRDPEGGARGAFVQVPLRPSDLPGSPVARAVTSAGSWSKVVVLAAAGERAAYAWLGPDTRLRARTLRLEAPPADLRSAARTLQWCSERLRVWESILDWYIEERAEDAATVEVVERLVLGLVRLQRFLSGMAGAMHEGRAEPGWFESALAALRRAGTQLLAVCVDVATATGVPDLGLHIAMRATGEVGDAGPCACGECPLRSQAYGRAEDGPADLLRLMCGCGDAGQESAGTPARLEVTTRRVRRGERTRLTLRCSAPPDRFVLAQGVVSLEPWLDKRPVHGPITEVLVQPGRSAALACEVRIPRRVKAGLYPVSLLAVVGGGLVHRKTLFRIED
ncbi:MAG TPA: hypothetical protein VK698_18205 [Kofleriaceae bacterium]|nr:hypothetical protein [Kofleriaceae bacterium]